MEQLRAHIRANIVYGVIAVLPLAILGYIAIQIYGYVEKGFVALNPYLGANPLIEVILICVLTIFALLAICYLFGALVSTQFGTLTYDRINAKFSEIIPAYEAITNLLHGFAGEKISYPPALISLYAPGAAVLGFVVEDDGEAFLTVFVPNTPLLTVGAIHLVERSRVQLIEGTSMGAANCIARWGSGLKEFRGSTIPPLSS